MKTGKIISIVLTAIALVIITSCGKNENTVKRDVNTRTDVQSVLEQGMEVQDHTVVPDDTSVSEVSEVSMDPEIPDDETVDEQINANDETADEQTDSENESSDGPAGTDGLDVDLTVLSSTMVYSEVYDMMYYPENYIGKTVKMKGSYAGYHDEITGKYYHACIIQDATACCAQGIEFEPANDYKYPDDYPVEGQEVCVTGVFDTYKEG